MKEKTEKKFTMRDGLVEFKKLHADYKDLLVFGVHNLLNRFFWQFEKNEVPTVSKSDAIVLAFFLMQHVSDKRLDKIILKFRESEV